MDWFLFWLIFKDGSLSCLILMSWFLFMLIFKDWYFLAYFHEMISFLILFSFVKISELLSAHSRQSVILLKTGHKNSHLQWWKSQVQITKNEPSTVQDDLVFFISKFAHFNFGMLLCRRGAPVQTRTRKKNDTKQSTWSWIVFGPQKAMTVQTWTNAQKKKKAKHFCQLFWT
jgi:hypothetical protein